MNSAQMKGTGIYLNAMLAKGMAQSEVLCLVYIWCFSLIPLECSVVTGYYITVSLSPKAGTIMLNIWMN